MIMKDRTNHIIDFKPIQQRNGEHNDHTANSADQCCRPKAWG